LVYAYLGMMIDESQMTNDTGVFLNRSDLLIPLFCLQCDQNMRMLH
jgi:hypothetical protein